jgi:hypothetical protein
MPVENKSPETTYVTKENISFPGNDSDADVAENKAQADLEAALDQAAGDVTVPAGSIELETRDRDSDRTAPVFTVAAAKSGTPTEDETLTATATAPDVANSGATVKTYQWKKADTSNGTYTNITGATASTYVVEAALIGKYIKILVTATNDVGATTSLSTATTQVQAA